MKKMCTSCFYAFVAAAIVATFNPYPAHGQLGIPSFGANGQLSWNDPGATGTNNYAVEWASSLNGNWKSWRDAEATLIGLGLRARLRVPMFYRVVATDPRTATQRYSYFENLPPVRSAHAAGAQ